MLNYLIILTLTTFFRRVEKLSKMELNKWIAPFMSHLRKFYLNDDLAFVYSDLLHEFGIAAADVKHMTKGNDREYFSSDFERILSKFWVQPPCAHWTRIEIYAMNNVLWFTKRVIFGTHFCDISCAKISKKYDSENDLVIESECLYLRNLVIRHPTRFDMNSMSERNYVLLEFQECFNTDGRNQNKLKFKKLSEQAKAPRRATEGSVGYDLYSAEKVLITPQSCSTVATDIALISPPGVYPRVAPRSSMALKNTNVGAGVIDIDYRGNVKVVIMNHSTNSHLNIEQGDRIAQFILTKYETPDVIEVLEIDSTERGSDGFGSTGQ